MKTGFVLALLMALACGDLNAGNASVDINGTTYTNISKVYIGAGNKVIILYTGGGTSAKIDAVPKDFLASWGIGDDKLATVKAAEAVKAEADLDRAIQAGAFRAVDGVVYDTRKAQAGWVNFKGAKVIQILSNGAILDADPRSYESLPIFVKNLPRGLGDTDFVTFNAKPTGSYSYVNKLGDDRTIRSYDAGKPCDRGEIPGPVLSGQVAFASEPMRGREQEDVVSWLPDSENLNATGSGFFVSDDGYFVTNDHVVKNARRIKLKVGSEYYPAKVVREDATNDLALIKVDGKFKALGVAATNAALGQAVFTIGFPDIKLQGTQPKYTDGKVSSLAGLKDDPLEYQISVPVQPGNSGGPLVDLAGKVCGVIVARLDEMAALRSMGSLPQNVNYAIKGSVLRDFLAQSSQIKLRPETAPQDNVVDQVRDSVGIVLVY